MQSSTKYAGSLDSTAQSTTAKVSVSLKGVGLWSQVNDKNTNTSQGTVKPLFFSSGLLADDPWACRLAVPLARPAVPLARPVVSSRLSFHPKDVHWCVLGPPCGEKPCRLFTQWSGVTLSK